MAVIAQRDAQQLGDGIVGVSDLRVVQVDERRDLDDADVTKVLAAYLKKVKDQVRSYGDGGRAELLAEAEAELKIVQEYLPTEMDDAQIDDLRQRGII